MRKNGKNNLHKYNIMEIIMPYKANRQVHQKEYFFAFTE